MNAKMKKDFDEVFQNNAHGGCDICGEHSTQLDGGVCQKSSCRKLTNSKSCVVCGKDIGLKSVVCDSHVCARHIEEGKGIFNA